MTEPVVPRKFVVRMHRPKQWSDYSRSRPPRSKPALGELVPTSGRSLRGGGCLNLKMKMKVLKMKIKKDSKRKVKPKRQA